MKSEWFSERINSKLFGDLLSLAVMSSASFYLQTLKDPVCFSKVWQPPSRVAKSLSSKNDYNNWCRLFASL